ncbi:hypothetical protein [Aquimarina sp. AU474]|uniref:hypothetical protein n=1 Tax=Aquimarina sp. AU474 TaxID=2108529 RepID=UPI000D694B6E|nr:hypothetical protein [Aquimarina sp. AU474]
MHIKNIIVLCLPLILYSGACKEDNGIDLDENINLLAEIVSVTFSGNDNEYTFNVGIKSPDTGCEQYADWWEVITEDKVLIYRRVLAHSHVNEQPFVRSGGQIPITKDQIVLVRAHMNTTGYGTKVYKGSIANGFKESELDKGFAIELSQVDPLPSGCAF